MRNSLRWRLVLAGGTAILVALGLSALGLALLFERHVERVAIADLDGRALALAAMVEPGPAGAALRDATPDPLYDQPFSGRYWQITLGGVVHRSRSLWDVTLVPELPAAPPGGRQVLALTGPQGATLLAVDHALTVEGAGAPLPLRIVVAVDRAGLTQVRQDFLGDLIPYVALLAGLLLLASWVQVSVGLRPLGHVGARVAALVAGSRARIGQDLPVEVIPLAYEIDTLLDARDREVQRARHRAGDLAHGFKTPLQALMGDAERLRDQGVSGVAANIETVVTAMRRLVDRELARARIQSDRRSASAEPGMVLRKIIGVLQRSPMGEAIDWRVEAAPGLIARIDPDDLTEALGALLENAMRHARSEVACTVAAEGARVLISIRDDGPGVAEADLARLIQRGVRLDEGGDGQGIGLAIVADIVEAAQGELTLRNANPGLLAEIRLARGAA